MAKDTKTTKSISRAELQAPAILAGIVRHVSSQFPTLREATASERLEKTYKLTDEGLEIALVFLQKHTIASEENIDEEVLSQIKKYLAEAKVLKRVSSITVNLLHEEL